MCYLTSLQFCISNHWLRLLMGSLYVSQVAKQWKAKRERTFTCGSDREVACRNIPESEEECLRRSVRKYHRDGSCKFRAVATTWHVRQGWANAMQWPNRKYIDCDAQDRGGPILSSARTENILVWYRGQGLENTICCTNRKYTEWKHWIGAIKC
jgi:hypothetical protein